MYLRFMRSGHIRIGVLVTVATLLPFCVRSQIPQVAKTSYVSAAVQRSGTEQGSGLRVRGSTLESINTSLDDLVEFSYETQRKQVRNLPSWGEERYDASLVFRGDNPPDDKQCKQMIRELLSERFGLEMHQEASQQETYALFVSPDGPKLAASMAVANGLPGLRLKSPGNMDAQNASTADLAQKLQRDVVGNPVMDRTHLTGRWDFTLKWTSEPASGGGHASLEKSALNRALEEQLGLTLQKVTASAPVLVVDKATQPALP